MTDELDGLAAPNAPPPASEFPPGATASPDGWRKDKAGRDFITIPGRRGPLYRRGEETIRDRLERDSRPKDEKPKPGGKRRRPKLPDTPDKPRNEDLRELEAALAEAFRSPSMIAGLAGDLYLANHFAMWGPRLARNLVVTSEHNPWLRRQLETMASGGAVSMTVITLIGLAGAVLCYTAPPIIYLFNLPAPDMARQMFSIPERRNGTIPQGPAAEVPAAPTAA